MDAGLQKFRDMTIHQRSFHVYEARLRWALGVGPDEARALARVQKIRDLLDERLDAEARERAKEQFLDLALGVGRHALSDEENEAEDRWADLAALVQEPPEDFVSAGREVVPVDPSPDRPTLKNRPTRSLGASPEQDFARFGGGGKGSETQKHGPGASTVNHDTRHTWSGLHAHHGTLHPDEHVDWAAVERAAEERLGFTLDRVRAAFAPGRPDAQRRAERDAIEDRLLELAEAGAVMWPLARAIGWPVRESGSDQMKRVLARARKRRDR
jgi:hypothetical protein